MKEVIVENGEDILHLELIEVLGLLAAETIANGYNDGEMIIEEINSNFGSFNYIISCERITEKVGLFDKIKRWFK